MIKSSLKKNWLHRLAEKYACKHFDSLIQLLLYIFTYRTWVLRLPMVRAKSLSTRESMWEDRKEEDDGKGEKKNESFEIQGSRIRHARLLMRDAIFRLQFWASGRMRRKRCAVYLIVPQFRTARIPYNTNSCQMAAASITTGNAKYKSIQ